MFKKILQAAGVVTLMAAPLIATSAEAQPDRKTVKIQRDGDRVVRTVNRRPNGTVVRRTTVQNRAPAYRRWAKGQRFDRRYARNYGVVDYRRYRNRRLYAPPRGYRWVRSGNDAVLIGITSGIVAASIAGALQ
jgi:Ni/Co efflux regulator RcnB